jgi:hypothetical protein
MSYRRLISVAVLAASAAVLPALPGQAAPSTGTCDGSYPTNSSTLSLSVTPRTITAGQAVTAFGELRQNRCAIKGASIRIEKANVVSGKVGSFTLVKTVTTDNNGLYVASYAPLQDVQIRARFLGWTSPHYLPATSNRIGVNVRTRISEAATKLSSCRIKLTGATRPVKKFHTVTIQKRGPKGHFNGWTAFASGKTNRYGHYSITKTATCGTTYNLSALIGKDATNLAGRSATIFGIKATR